MAEPRLYSARECAKELNVSELTIHRLLRQHNAPKVMGVFAVPQAFLDKLKRERGIASAANGKPVAKKRGAAA